METEPFLNELENLEPSNALYHNWWKYALKLSRDDVLNIVRGGLTYQADALISMIKEMTAGQDLPGTLQKKLKLIKTLCRNNASKMQ